MHFRTREQDEVDLVLEDRRDRIVAIEVKAAATLRLCPLLGPTETGSLGPQRDHDERAIDFSGDLLFIKPLFFIDKRLERAMGIEPTTFSLGS